MAETSKAVLEFVNQVAVSHGTAKRVSAMCIGSEAAMVEQILRLVADGDKTGTFSLPWLAQHNGEPAPTIGDILVLTDMEGAPKVATQLTSVEAVSFDDIDEKHTAIDGPAIREVSLWKQIHSQYWGAQLQAIGRSFDPQMPVWVLRFEILRTDLP